MVNGLLDFGDQDGVSFQAGLGFGRARVKLIDDKDSAWAWQAILGINYAISPNMDLGMRYKYFTTGDLEFDGGSETFVRGRIIFCVATRRTARFRNPGDDCGGLLGRRHEVQVA